MTDAVNSVNAMNNDVQAEPARRGRPRKERQRRNYARDLERLQAKVEMAVLLLGRCGDLEASEGVKTILGVVIDTLSEE